MQRGAGVQTVPSAAELFSNLKRTDAAGRSMFYSTFEALALIHKQDQPSTRKATYMGRFPTSTAVTLELVYEIIP